MATKVIKVGKGQGTYHVTVMSARAAAAGHAVAHYYAPTISDARTIAKEALAKDGSVFVGIYRSVEIHRKT